MWRLARRLILWVMRPIGTIRNLRQHDQSLGRVLQERLSELRNASDANDTAALRSGVASRRHRRETRELRTVLTGTLSRLAE